MIVIKELSKGNEMTETTARHEAGHVAALIFIGQSRKITEISIVPNNDSLGRVGIGCIGLGYDNDNLKLPLRLYHGYQRIIYSMAGYVAEKYPTGNSDDFEYEDTSYEDWEAVNEITCCLDSVKLSGYKIYLNAYKWTTEIISSPEYQEVILEITKDLIEQKEIPDPQTYLQRFNEIEGKLFYSAKWKKRLLIKK